MSIWWSWLLTAVGVLAVYLIGSQRRSGFALGVAAQALWIVYAVVTEQYGFVIASLLYATMYARGWKKWTSNDTSKA